MQKIKMWRSDKPINGICGLHGTELFEVGVNCQSITASEGLVCIKTDGGTLALPIDSGLGEADDSDDKAKRTAKSGTAKPRKTNSVGTGTGGRHKGKPDGGVRGSGSDGA